MEPIILEGKTKLTCLSMGLGGMGKLCFRNAWNYRNRQHSFDRAIDACMCSLNATSLHYPPAKLTYLARRNQVCHTIHSISSDVCWDLWEFGSMKEHKVPKSELYCKVLTPRPAGAKSFQTRSVLRISLWGSQLDERNVDRNANLVLAY